MIAESSNKEFQKLPDSWKAVKLGDVIDIQGGSQPPKKHFIYEPQEGYVRLLQIRDFGDKPVPTYVPKGKVTKFCAKGDIFIARYGASLGRIVTGMEGAYNVALAKVIFDKETFFFKFLFYLLQTPYFQTPIHMISRSAQNGFNKGEIFPIEIPLAPLNEQKRIVAEIEKQFSRLDEAVDNLKRIKANLKRYKASVLKAAVEGKLTEEWRKANPDVEPAGKLLERILVERQKKWEDAELAKMKAKGKEPKDDKWKKKYQEPDVAGQIEIELPNNWVRATVKQLTERVQYGSSSKTNEDSDGIPVLRMGNIFEGKLILDKLKYLPELHNEFPELLLKSNDLLFNRTNSFELVGKTAIYKGNPSVCSFASYLIRTRFINGVDSKFIGYFINSNYGRKWIKSVVSQQVGQANVNGTKLQALLVPLPPQLEQNQIVSEVENIFSIIDGIENEVKQNLLRADRLRQSILKKAFTGKLVPQEKNSESNLKYKKVI